MKDPVRTFLTWLLGSTAYQPIGNLPSQPTLARTAGLIALFGPMAVILVLETGVVEQLSDVFSPGTAAVERVTSINVRGIFPQGILGETIYPIDWLFMWGVAIGVGYVLFRSFARIGWVITYRNDPNVDNPYGLWRRSRKRLPIKGRMLTFRTCLELFRRRLQKKVSRWLVPPLKNQRFKRFLTLFPLGDLRTENQRSVTAAEVFLRLWLFVIFGIPMIFAAGVILAQLMNLVLGGNICPQPVALGFGLSLLIVLIESIALLIVSDGLGLRSTGKTILALPYFVFFILLFADIKQFPDTGYSKDMHDKGFASLTKLEPKSGTPLICIACSGGGSRAALFAAGIFRELWWKAIDRNVYPLTRTKDSSKEGANTDLDLQFNAAVNWKDRVESFRSSLDLPEDSLVFPSQEPQVFYPGRLLLLRADLMSSVSGGSLPAAFVENWIVEQSPGWNKPENQKDPLSVERYRGNALSKLFALPSGEFSTVRQQARELLRMHQAPDRLPYVDAALAEVTDKFVDLSETLPTSHGGEPDRTFVGNMAQDHLAAVIAGFAEPWLGRGPAIEDFWENRLHWPNQFDSAGRISFWAGPEEKRLIPHLAINTTRVSSGGRVAITNLDASLFKALPTLGPDLRGISNSNARFDATPGEVHVLRELLPNVDISIARAVRASSNFPIGFPLLIFPTENKEMPIEVTDGGVKDNTGLDTILAALRHYGQNGGRSRGGEGKKAYVLEIDSGELPTDHKSGLFDRIDHHLSGAEAAMWRGSVNSGAEETAYSLIALEKAFTDPHDHAVMCSTNQRNDLYQYTAGRADDHYAFFRVRLGEEAADHVSTSWHLSRSERGKIYCQLESDTVQNVLCVAVCQLVSFTPPRPNRQSSVQAPK